MADAKKKFSFRDFLYKVKKTLFPKGIIWPTWKDTLERTGIVLLISVLAALLLIGADALFSLGIGLLAGI